MASSLALAGATDALAAAVSAGSVFDELAASVASSLALAGATDALVAAVSAGSVFDELAAKAAVSALAAAPSESPAAQDQQALLVHSDLGMCVICEQMYVAQDLEEFVWAATWR